MILNKELSTNEKKMFTDLGWDYLFSSDIAVYALYDMAMEKAFVGDNKNVLAVCALQRAVKHLRDEYRGNAQFEELISY